MPAPDVAPHTKHHRPVLGHVNLMADTLIANASLDDLRAIVRTLLATSPPAVAASFTAAARSRLGQAHAKSRPTPAALFAVRDAGAVPTHDLGALLAYVRSLYGAGMGFTSLEILASVVRATAGLRWPPEGPMADVLAMIDADISQAVQSCKEELGAGHARDAGASRAALHSLRAALDECRTDAEGWGGDFPFERGAANVEGLQC